MPATSSSLEQREQAAIKAPLAARDALNSALREAHHLGLFVELDQANVRTVGDRYELPVVNIVVERRERIV